MSVYLVVTIVAYLYLGAIVTYKGITDPPGTERDPYWVIALAPILCITLTALWPVVLFVEFLTEGRR